MVLTRTLEGVRAMARGVVAHRNLGVMAPAMQKAVDPIQQLFVDKIKEYRQKSSGGKLVDATPDIENELKSELEKLAKIYGGDAKTDMTQFPNFKFNDPKLDSPNF